MAKPEEKNIIRPNYESMYYEEKSNRDRDMAQLQKRHELEMKELESRSNMIIANLKQDLEFYKKIIERILHI